MYRSVAVLVIALAVVSCGGGGKRDNADNRETVAVSTGGPLIVATPDAGLPAECTSAPYTVVAQRDGEMPAGSAGFGVIGTAALPIPLVPDKSRALTPAQVIEQGASTDLVGYALFFGDEQFGPSDVSMFGGYGPIADGASRGTISLFPKTATPISAGDTLMPGALDGLEMFTTLQSVLMDFKATPDELTAYLDVIAGSVTVLGLTDTALCLDVDLSWQYSKGSSPGGTLTLNGIFTAPLAPRTTPFT